MSSRNQSPSLLQRKSDEVEAARVGGATVQDVTALDLPELGVTTTGVVFVHGIGEQARAEILLQWSGPIVRAIADWSRSLDEEDRVEGPIPSAGDRVVRTGIDFEGSDLPLVTVSVPGTNAGGAQHGPQTWVMTEARWAQDVAPPSLETMIEWCGPRGVVAAVVDRIVNESLASHPAPTIRGRRELTGLVDWIRRAMERGSGVLRPVYRIGSRMGLTAFVSIVVTLGLLAYSLVRAIASFIPNKSIQDAVARVGLDTFLTTWWGDVYVLLDDPVQAANIRGQVAKAIRALRHFGCERIVLVAHSGGTIVSYMALADNALSERVETFITHGQAIQMGRTIWTEDGADSTSSGVRITAGTPIRADRWRDFHGTHDPAPSGRLEEATNADRRPPDVTFRDDETWNRMSIAEDHGEYFSNDEEFVEELLTEIETAGRPGAESRFTERREKRTHLHQQRVFVLALWKRLMFVIPTMAIFAAFFTPSGGLIGELARAAGTVVAALPVVPDVFRWIHSVVPVGPNGLATASATVFAVIFGLAIIQAAMPIGRLWVWDSAWRWLVFGALDTGVFVLGIVVAIAVRAFAQNSAGAGVTGFVVRFGDTPVLVALLLLVGSAAALVVAGPRARTVDDRRPFPLWVRLGFIAISFAIILIALYGVIVDDQIRAFVAAVVVAFALYQVLGRIGIWRWGRWDDAERALGRRRSDAVFPRSLVWGEFLPLGGVAAMVALGIAIGSTQLLILAGWGLAAFVFFLVVFDVAIRDPADLAKAPAVTREQLSPPGQPAEPAPAES